MLRGFKVRAPVLGVLIAVGLLVACDDAPPEQSPTATPSTSAPRPQAPQSAAVPPQMVAAVAAGKSASVLGVHFALGAAPEVGKALPVEIAIVPHQDFVSLKAYFEGYEGLTVMTGMQLPSQAAAAAEKLITHQLVVLPKEPGMHLLSAAVETDGSEGNVVRVFSIPVIVGPTGEPKSATP